MISRSEAFRKSINVGRKEPRGPIGFCLLYACWYLLWCDIDRARDRQIFIATKSRVRTSTILIPDPPRYVHAVKCWYFLYRRLSFPCVDRDRHDGREGRARQGLFRMFFRGFSFLSRKTLYLFVLEARVKWLTALLVQHYEGFHPDLVALNRQPTGNQAAC